MILLASTEAQFVVPVDTLFNYVTNMENYGRWFPGVKSILSKNNLAHGAVGKTYVETLEFPDGTHDLIIEVVRSDHNRYFLTHGDLDGILPQMSMVFRSNDANSCTFALQYHSRNPALTEDSEIVSSLRNDLSSRIEVAKGNLHDWVVSISTTESNVVEKI